MINLKNIPSIIIILIFSHNTYSFELTSGVISKGRETVRNEEQKRVSPIIKAAIKEQSSNPLTRSIGYTNLSTGDIWYRFTRDLKVHAVNTETKQYLGNWPLTRWIHLSVPPERLVPPGLSNLEETLYSEQYHSTGCLSATPLRYGDIETDGTDELVLVLNDELIIFSPKMKKIVFAMFIDASDWWPWGEEDLLKEYILSNDGISPLDSELYHGNSHTGADLAMSGQFMPALRAYSKFFIGDFDSDQNYDIIKWEKIYTSNKKTEAPAWVQLRNELIHYKKDITGEYLPQVDTSEAAIQGWLTAKNQTWQSGFPSKSECAGQEGQLIPEMHDPLLNDPDVLK